MAANFQGLENKLEVHIGDLLFLQAENGDEVVGFVRDFGPTYVRLSHESHTNMPSWLPKYTNGFTRGDRTFFLRLFSQYKVVDLSNPVSDRGQLK